VNICFVCSGNICRSPSAEVVMRALLVAEGLPDAVEVCSAGLGDWHVGEAADHRSLAELAARGYDANRHRARQFEPSWFDQHDLVVAMDHTHLRALRRMAPSDQQGKVSLLMSFAGEDVDVPDPYYGGADGFVHVLDMIEKGCRGLLSTIRHRLPA
jgi:protein-tyrosine phosphatase